MKFEKKIRGYYFRLDYAVTGVVVDELERFFRINDRFLKFMTIMLADNADVEKNQGRNRRCQVFAR